MDTLRLPATADSLEAFRAFVDGRAAAAGVPDELVPKVELVLEEVLTNHARHAYHQGQGVSEVTCVQPEPGVFCMQFVDRGSPFDPLELPLPELSGDLARQPVGGMGLALVRRFATRVEYLRTTDLNILTVWFETAPERRGFAAHAPLA